MSNVRGMDALIKIRRSGEKPNMPVWLWVGFQRGKNNGVALNLEMERPTATADLRGLVGLDVVVCAKCYSPAMMDLWVRVKQVCKSGVLWVESWGDDPSECVVLYSRERGEWTF